jgi:type IV pilus assembly protein PilV
MSIRDSRLPQHSSANPSSSGGFSMLESLVAVLVFSFGAIGATGMQVLATQANFEATQRTQAVYFATDIIERMLNNPDGIDSYDSSGDNRWTIVGAGSIGVEPTPNCDTSHCSAAQQAAHDLWSWEQALDGSAITTEDDTAVGGMASPTGCIRHSGGGRIEVAIAWRGRSSMTDTNTAPECTVEDRYGNDSEYRRVLHLRTFIADLTQN